MLDGLAKFLIHIKSDWLLNCFTFITKSPGTFPQDRICSDPFGIRSIVERIHLFTRDRFKAGMVRFHMGSLSKLDSKVDPFGTR